MINVIDLIRNYYLTLFFILFILEIIVLILLIILFGGPIKTNRDNIENYSYNNTIKIVNSFNKIIIRHYYAIETDLLIIAKHLYPMYLTLSKKDSQYPKILKETDFYNSYGNCLINDEEIGLILNDDLELSNSTSDYHSSFDITKYLRKYLKNDSYEDEVINNLFNVKILNKISIYPKIANENSDIQIFSCYALSILKTLLIRNLVMEKDFIIHKSYSLFLENKFLFKYPPTYMDKVKDVMIYYNDKCNNKYETRCFNTFIKYNQRKFNDKIYFDTPMVFKEEYLMSRGCIKINYNMTDENYVCIDFDLLSMFAGIQPEINDLIQMFIIIDNKEYEDVSMLFWSKMRKYATKSINIKRPIFKEILTENGLPLNSLFTGIYYSTIDHIDLKKYNDTNKIIEIKQTIIKEYLNISEKLRNFIKNDTNKIGECEINNGGFYNINETLSFSQFNKDITGNSNSTDGDYTFKKDKYQLVMIPLKLNITTYNNTTYVFKTKCSTETYFYTIAIVKTGSEIHPNEIFRIYVMKCIRYAFFFASILQICIVSCYIITELYVKFLINPIKKITKKLEDYIRERNNEKENCFISEQTQGSIENIRDLKKIKNNEKSIEKNNKYRDNGLSIFRSAESKRIEEESLEFLKKILIMKNTKEYYFNEKSNIYKKIKSYLKNSKPEHIGSYHQCLMINIYSYFENKEFNEIYYEINELVKSLEDNINQETSNNNDTIENDLRNFITKNRNYTNEFNYSHIAGNYSESLNRLIKNKVFLQRVYYIEGIVKYNEYESISPNSNETKKLLQEAIHSLNKALTINTELKFNKVKIIVILIMLAKCHYHLSENDKSVNCIKQGIINLSELNKYIFDNNQRINPKIMFLINCILMENLLFYLGKICLNIKKTYLANYIFNRITEISYFKTIKIHKEIHENLDKFLFKEDYSDEIGGKAKLLLDKTIRRYNMINKKLSIIVSENFMKNFNSLYELRDVLKKCIEKYINSYDLISYYQYDTEVRCKIDLNKKIDNFIKFKDNSIFMKPHGINNTNKTLFYESINKAIDDLVSENLSYNEKDLDSYIFIFQCPNDIKFKSEEENKNISRKLIMNNVSLYIFCFDLNIKHEKIMKIKNFINFLIEGYLVLVKNFDIIKQVFQNISNNKERNNILKEEFENHLNIL